MFLSTQSVVACLTSYQSVQPEDAVQSTMPPLMACPIDTYQLLHKACRESCETGQNCEQLLPIKRALTTCRRESKSLFGPSVRPAATLSLVMGERSLIRISGTDKPRYLAQPLYRLPGKWKSRLEDAQSRDTKLAITIAATFL